MNVFREGFEGEMDADVQKAASADGAVIATVTDGNMTGCKDNRITVRPDPTNSSNIIIRYPGTMDYRFDVKPIRATTDLNLTLKDLAPVSGTNVKATYGRNSSTGNIEGVPAREYNAMLVQDGSTNTVDANEINTYSDGNNIAMQPNQTLHILAWHGSNSLDTGAAKEAEYAIQLTTPTTKLVDFSSVTVAENADLGRIYNADNGAFAESGDNVVYQLNTTKNRNATTYTAFADVDTANADRFADTTKTRTQQLYLTDCVSTVPASSVYYDDALTTPVTSDGHGYSTDIDDQAVSKSAAAASGTFYYTFYGTGVDVYCTTDSESGYVSAAVFQTDDPTACSKDNRVGKAVTVSNKSSEGTRYNTPTISFMNLGEADVYTLKIVANEGAQFKLDGVRVYNPVMAGTAAAEAQAEAGEGNVVYINLHDILLNAKNDYTVTPGITTEYKTDENGEFVLDENGQKIPIIDPSAVSGVLYLDDVNSIKTTSHYDADQVWHEEELTIYKDQFDVYKNNSPKNEIYLAAADGEKKQAITFQLDTDKVRAGSPIYIGLSAPETGSGTVLVNGEALKPAVHSVIDMYYAVTVPEDGVITITNDGDSLISITNLKIPGVSNADEINSMSAADKPAAMKAFFKPMTPATVAMAANSLFSAPKANWNETANENATLLSELFRLLLQSLDTLFANVQTW